MQPVILCRQCRFEVAAMWTFCPACGCAVERGPAALPAEPAAPNEHFIAAIALLLGGRLEEAEVALQSAIACESSPDPLLMHARLLLDRNDFQNARTALDQAVAIAPQNFMVRVRRAEFLARVGLYRDALFEAQAARRFAPDVASLLHAQDLERRLQELNRNSFVREAHLPSLPSWLRLPLSQLKKSPRPTNTEV